MNVFNSKSKKYLTGLFISGVLGILFIVISDASNYSLRVMTFNIRYDNPNDGVNRWQNRRNEVSNVINKYSPDVIGIQEGLKNQLDFLEKNCKGYNWLGMARDDGKEKGEYTAIFYNTNRFILIKDSTFWLSPTSDVPSKGWDANLHRTATWAKFHDKKTKEKLFVFNTHFDHEGSAARKKSAFLLKEQISRITENIPFVLMGDFNLTPDSDPYAVLTDSTQLTLLFDTRFVSLKKHQGPDGTFNGFGFSDKGLNRIDYIFVGENIDVMSHFHAPDRYEENAISDHFPVIVDLTLKGNNDHKN